jgi:hypothetical protein
VDTKDSETSAGTANIAFDSLKTPVSNYQNMPIYLHHFNLIVPKSVLEAKYRGGVEQFKRDFFYGDEINDMEDGELLGTGYMGPDIDLEKLMDAGLSYNKEESFSEDFIIIGRYAEPPLLWPCDWIIQNRVHAWHINASEANKQRAIEIGNMPMDEIIALFDLNQNLLRAFWIKD